MEETPMSLRDLMRYHRELFVAPLYWTSRHLALVGCRFESVDKPSTTPTAARPEDDSNSPSPVSIHDVHPLPTELSSDERHAWFIDMLVGKRTPFDEHRIGTAFHFTDIRIHRPFYSLFVRRDQTHEETNQGSPPVVGHFDYTEVTTTREKKFQPWPDPSGRPNSIGERLGMKRLAEVTPQDWSEDPYFSRLFVTNVSDEEYVHLYDARITNELIAVLKDPNAATEYVQWPTIYHIMLPYKPYESFMDRLVAELVAPGPVCSTVPPEDTDGVGGYPAKRPWEEESDSSQKARRLW
ncbi:hypothetical protein BO78DRAFT_412039 [Aspergillus sclerotiicarbonarius CBS 121057]|uniref:Uncharacterized protein n=1 Tax=Aspergillus sclerotiicarbonarius (strain CBS 121057 / IBT 28362) TaxID=1448318 RepID=A0A319EIW6_ASPSB|nr:hypothetical protein BO78DRAFT_412039 [Aspergillus sclerotiicarbonarius CBS 121057]